MKRGIVHLLLFSMLCQLGCSGITQIPYPVDKSKSENEVRQLNYFGERLNSTIQFTSQVEVDAYWLKMREDKIYFLTEGLDDTISVTVDKVESVKFFDWWRGCLYGGISCLISGTGLIGLSNLTYSNTKEFGFTLFPTILSILPFAYGMYAFSEREFNFVQE